MSVALLMVPVGNKMMTDIVEKASAEAVKFKLNSKTFLCTLSQNKNRENSWGFSVVHAPSLFSALCMNFPFFCQVNDCL